MYVPSPSVQAVELSGAHITWPLCTVSQVLFLIMSKLCSVCRLEITAPVTWALNTNN